MYQHFISTSKFKINICIANFSCPCYLSSQVATRSALAFSFYLPFSSTTFSHGSLGGGLIISRNAFHRQQQQYCHHHHFHLVHSNRCHSMITTTPITRLEKRRKCTWVFPLFSCYPQVNITHFLFGTEFFLFKFEI